jgi:very-short-patch-repair endonuclease
MSNEIGTLANNVISFASHEKSKYWSDKNDIKPENILNNKSHKKYWFNCNKCFHDFEISLSHINEGKWCPFCNIKLCLNDDCKYCYEKSFASNEKSKFWDNQLNIDIKPRNITKSSGKSYYFNCEYGHQFLQKINYIHNGKWCKLCCNSKRLCKNETCEKCINASFINNEKTKYWNYELNNNLNPRNIFNNNNNKFWFFCELCNHNFQISPLHINEGKWCSYCYGDLLCGNSNIECNYCYEKSFASSDKSNFWITEKNNNLMPIQIRKNSGKKYWFKCNNCPHIFKKILSDITGSHWCPYCCISSSLFCDNKDNCNHCYEKSFASHEKSKYWNYELNLDINPKDITKYTPKKFYFNCDKCNKSFNSIIGNITKLNSWCPYCINKTEKKLYDKLSVIYPNLIHQYKVEWCKNKICLPFDFCIEEYKIIIELDGLQHFDQVSNWSSPEKNQERDKYKMKCANENNYSIIRILQEDVLYDTFDWFEEIKQTIKKIIDDKIKIIQNIFICKNNEYDIFK